MPEEPNSSRPPCPPPPSQSDSLIHTVNRKSRGQFWGDQKRLLMRTHQEIEIKRRVDLKTVYNNFVVNVIEILDPVKSIFVDNIDNKNYCL